MHAHSDLSVLHTPDHLAKITQGVTTEVLGQDGISYAPTSDETMARVRRQISGWNGNPADPGFFDRWRTVKEYLDVLDKEKTATNTAFLVPQGNLRMLVKGYSSEKCTQAEIDQQKEILAKCLEEGAVGMSSGLTYVPGAFADTDELAQLCEVVKKYDAYYCPHHRSYGKGALGAYEEMFSLAKKTGVRLHLAHATMNYPENAGRANELVSLIDEAIASGVDVSLDTYPYLPGSTTLASTLPSWAASAEDKIALLDDPEKLARIRHQALVEGTDGCHGCTLRKFCFLLQAIPRQGSPVLIVMRLRMGSHSDWRNLRSFSRIKICWEDTGQDCGRATLRSIRCLRQPVERRRLQLHHFDAHRS